MRYGGMGLYGMIQLVSMLVGFYNGSGYCSSSYTFLSDHHLDRRDTSASALLNIFSLRRRYLILRAQ